MPIPTINRKYILKDEGSVLKDSRSSEGEAVRTLTASPLRSRLWTDVLALLLLYALLVLLRRTVRFDFSIRIHTQRCKTNWVYWSFMALESVCITVWYWWIITSYSRFGSSRYVNYKLVFIDRVRWVMCSNRTEFE